MSTTMQTISLNGTAREIPVPCTLGQLLELLDLDRRIVVVEHNRIIIRRDVLDGVSLAAGDVVEIVHFVGGG